jgi:uncharacterized protein (TIGR00288 family)
MEQKIALFLDFENIALGVKEARQPHLDVQLILQRLLEKGKVLVKRAYGDWTRYREYRKDFHSAAIDMIEVPQRSLGGKNSADIRLVVDALELCYSKDHMDTFAIASGDSDFSPLVSKLRENAKYVIGIGVRNSTSELLVENCDEFVFYEDLLRVQKRRLQGKDIPKQKVEAFELVISAIQALERDAAETIWASMVKETVKRKKPSFDEGHYGYGGFSKLLEDARKYKLLQLKKDERSGSYIVTDYVSL